MTEFSIGSSAEDAIGMKFPAGPRPGDLKGCTVLIAPSNSKREPDVKFRQGKMTLTAFGSAVVLGPENFSMTGHVRRDGTNATYDRPVAVGVPFSIISSHAILARAMKGHGERRQYLVGTIAGKPTPKGEAIEILPPRPDEIAAAQAWLAANAAELDFTVPAEYDHVETGAPQAQPVVAGGPVGGWGAPVAAPPVAQPQNWGAQPQAPQGWGQQAPAAW